MSTRRSSLLAGGPLVAIGLLFGACGGQPFLQPAPGAHGAKAPSRFAAPAGEALARFTEQQLTIPFDPPLSASLCLPQPDDRDRGEERPATALLVPGWGAAERDATVGPNKPMRDLAWGLAARGIAVLRYDPPRALGTPPSSPDEELTVGTVAVEPALGAARWLLGHTELDARRVVAIGHSIGGLAVVRLAAREPALAGYVVMAAATRPLEQVLVDQLRHVAELDGVTTERERAMLAALEQQARRVAELDARAELAPEELPLGLPVAFWLDLQSAPLARLLATEHRPVLVVHGGGDYQVTDRDFAGWRTLLARAPRAAFRRYAGLNHLFMATSGARSPTEYRASGHMAAEVIADVADWIDALEPTQEPPTPSSAPSPE